SYVSRSGVAVSTRAASASRLHVQARPRAGGRLRVGAQERPSADPSTRPPGARGTVSGDGGNRARTAGPPCAAGRVVGPGRDLFPASWGAGLGPLSLS